MPKVLAVVAHHDDHVLWMGGIIRTLKHWDWTLLAMCVQRQDRRDYFCDFCRDVGADGRTIDCHDYAVIDNAQHPNDAARMQQRLLTSLGTERFDWVFTHSKDESLEYGRHDNHREVRDAVTSVVKRGHLTNGELRIANFSYGFIGGRTASTARIDSVAEKQTHYFQLTYRELDWKLKWCTKVPDLANLRAIGCPCPNPEAFTCDGLKRADLPDRFWRNDLRE